MSPGGNYLLYFDQPSGDWFTYHISSGTKTNLTERLAVKFFDEIHDTPSLPPSLGSAGWTDGDRTVVAQRSVRPLGNPARRQQRAQ